MMKMEIAEDFSASNDQTIVKGKRTKRQRPSSSAAEISTTTSSEISTNTEEDEDMANCLILLARGSSPPPAAAAENKFSSRKFTQMGTTTNAKVGIYVYECKTCNRTFPSFQALGGHRASHKKPKSTTDNDRKNSPPSPPAAATEEEKAQLTIPAITQLHNKSCQNDPNKAKIHDCTICGSEFASGQALGGHMRRHRPATSTTNGTRLIGASNHNDTMPYDVGEKKPMLTLDLNLPAPAEDDKFHQFPTKQPPQLVFSAAALVDCHN